MIHSIEILLYVQVYYPFAAVVQVLKCLLHCCVTASVRSETVTVIAETRVVYFHERLRNCLLDYPVCHCRYTERSHFTVALGYIYPSYRLRSVSLFQYCCLYFSPPGFEIPVKLIHGHLIDSRGTFVLLD